jgi:hypothetical protein
MIVNHETKQCATMFPGDECVYATLPDGWVSLGWEGSAECPAGYEEVELQVEYRGIKDQHCCSEWGSGAPGDCDDLVISRRNRQCAFVEDIEGCNLSSRWEKKPEKEGYWECPGEYSWVDDLECLTVEEVTQSSRKTGRPILTAILVIACLGSLVLLALVVLLVWFIVRRRKR